MAPRKRNTKAKTQKGPGRTGRPSKIDDPAVIAALQTAIRMGAPIATACAFAGIHKDSFYTWRQKGEAQESGKYRDFADSVKKWQAEGELTLLKKIHQADAWQAAAWLLERRKPDEYGRFTRDKQDDGKPILWDVVDEGDGDAR